MKHPWGTTLLLVALFVVAQAIGLALVNTSIAAVTVVDGETVLEHSETAIGERPQLAGPDAFLYILIIMLFAVAIFLLIVKFKKVRIWKAWYFMAVFLSLLVAFGVFLPYIVAVLLALGLALLKILRPNPVTHNVSEVFIYAGIAVLIVPLFDPFWALLLLLVISVYDIIAVRKTKHMVAMAEFQRGSGMFAGLLVPKKEQPVRSTTVPHAAKRADGALPLPPLPKPGGQAILGGGDIAFPLVFSGVVMEWLVRGGPFVLLNGTPFRIATSLVLAPLTKTGALFTALLITLFTALSLLALFMYAKKDRYYPAMPFVTAGCIAGLIAVLI
jgi:presenilin-like A22 family membrane protease